jgi:hypothetical protein
MLNAGVGNAAFCGRRCYHPGQHAANGGGWCYKLRPAMQPVEVGDAASEGHACCRQGWRYCKIASTSPVVLQTRAKIAVSEEWRSPVPGEVSVSGEVSGEFHVGLVLVLLFFIKPFLLR